MYCSSTRPHTSLPHPSKKQETQPILTFHSWIQSNSSLTNQWYYNQSHSYASCPLNTKQSIPQTLFSTQPLQDDPLQVHSAQKKHTSHYHASGLATAHHGWHTHTQNGPHIRPFLLTLSPSTVDKTNPRLPITGPAQTTLLCLSSPRSLVPPGERGALSGYPGFL